MITTKRSTLIKNNTKIEAIINPNWWIKMLSSFFILMLSQFLLIPLCFCLDVLRVESIMSRWPSGRLPNSVKWEDKGVEYKSEFGSLWIQFINRPLLPKWINPGALLGLLFFPVLFQGDKIQNGPKSLRPILPQRDYDQQASNKCY